MVNLSKERSKESYYIVIFSSLIMEWYSNRRKLSWTKKLPIMTDKIRKFRRFQRQPASMPGMIRFSTR